jgi:WD40 repeat protein
MKEQNLLCLQNERVMKIWTLTGQNISTIKLGKQAEGIQYNYKAKELLFIYKNSLTGYMPDKQRTDLILEKQNPKVRYFVYGNKIIESDRNEEFLIEWENGKLKKDKVKNSNDKIYLKVQGTVYVRTHVSENFRLPKKHEVIIYDILTGNPLVHLKDTIELPDRITFSEDGNLIATYNKLLNNGDYNSTPYFTLFNSKGDKLRRFSFTSFCERIRFSSDNSKILSTDRKTAILWDTSGNQLFNYIGHRVWINDVDISSDNKYVLTSSLDKTVRLWSVEGTPLKVIDTEADISLVSFLHDGTMFQIADKNYVKIYDINGILIQKVPTDRSSLAIYSPEDRSIIYTDINGIHKTRLKEPVESFLLTNNFLDLSLEDKIEYDILSMRDLLASRNPYEIFVAGSYYINKVNKIIDVAEKKSAIKTAEQLLNKGLELDTLHGTIAQKLTQMYIQEKQFLDGNVNYLVEKCFKIISESSGSEELINAISFYALSPDTTKNSYKFPEKAISISEKILNLFPNEKSIRNRVSMLCSNLSFQIFIYSSQYQNSLKAVKTAIKADSTNQYSYTNLPLAYLFNNMYPKAEKEYLKWKDIPWTVTKDFKTYREAFITDIEDLESRRITHPDFAKVKELLKK